MLAYIARADELTGRKKCEQCLGQTQQKRAAERDRIVEKLSKSKGQTSQPTPELRATALHPSVLGRAAAWSHVDCRLQD